MEGHREEIEAIARRTRMTEPEARARYHLMEAFKALREVADSPVVPGEKPLGPEYGTIFIAPHFDTLINFLARRVLEREHPEGWRRPKGATQEEE